MSLEVTEVMKRMESIELCFHIVACYTYNLNLHYCTIGDNLLLINHIFFSVFVEAVIITIFSASSREFS